MDTQEIFPDQVTYAGIMRSGSVGSRLRLVLKEARRLAKKDGYAKDSYLMSGIARLEEELAPMIAAAERHRRQIVDPSDPGRSTPPPGPQAYLLLSDSTVEPRAREGMVVYDLLKPDYGLSGDDTRNLGFECISVTLSPDGDYPSFSVPRSTLRALAKPVRESQEQTS